MPERIANADSFISIFAFVFAHLVGSYKTIFSTNPPLFLPFFKYILCDTT